PEHRRSGDEAADVATRGRVGHDAHRGGHGTKPRYGTTFSSAYCPRLSWLEMVQMSRYLPGRRFTVVVPVWPGKSVLVGTPYCFSTSSPSGRLNCTTTRLWVRRPVLRAVMVILPAVAWMCSGRTRYSSRRTSTWRLGACE